MSPHIVLSDEVAKALQAGAPVVALESTVITQFMPFPKTLEALETNGVPVIGFGTDEFPAFFARGSGDPVDRRRDTPAGIASVIRLQGELGMRGGVRIVNPAPEAAALDADEIERHIAEAVRQADREGVSRKAPYGVNRINELSEGKSLGANLALVLNNARVASQIAIALCESNPKTPQV